MKDYYYNKTYSPSKDLKFRLRKLAEIAALAKLCNQVDLYKQAKEQHDSLVSQYNSVARTKKKGFWGQFVDNLTNTTTNVIMADYLEDDSNYQNTFSSYSALSNKPELIVVVLKNTLHELARGSDLLSKYDM